MYNLHLTFIAPDEKLLEITIPCVRKGLTWKEVCPAAEEIQTLIDLKDEILFVDGSVSGTEETPLS